MAYRKLIPQIGMGNLEIRNFKSIRSLKLECKKVNIFIGEPNTGKSNILETIGLLSHLYYSKYSNIKEFIRMEDMINLFYDGRIDEKIKIKFDEKFLEVEHNNDQFIGKMDSDEVFNYRYEGNGSRRLEVDEGKPFKFYRFKVERVFSGKEAEFLYPPFGNNLFMIIRTHKELRGLIKELFEPFGLKIALRYPENKIELQKEEEDIISSFPYSLISDTLLRVVFYLAILETNRDSIIVLEEPESNSFPYYTKYLAERIAFDKSNQFFISTHNPYFLLSVLEKTPKEDIGIFITYFKNYQTKVKTLNNKEIEEILDLDTDVFFNIEKFTE
ncbi:AAA family ATPase [candidate division WOR-3 bacterium]|nr:AAA family ATPase [candidate division WOR-3 bacterium]